MATIRDIAKLAEVSAATVSRILNQDETLSVTQATRERVLKTASELNYQKKSQESKETSMGIFQWYTQFQELEDPYYQSIRTGIERYCASRQIEVKRFFQSDVGYAEALREVRALICIGKYDQDQINTFKSLNPNVLFLDMKTDRISCNTLSLDFNQAVFDVLSYLEGLGHKRIAYLGGIERLQDGSIYPEERKEAFEAYCTAHHLKYRPWLIEGEFSTESGYEMALRLLKAPGPRPTAIFAASDPIALGAMRAIREAGLKIPEDISVVGFDDISMAAYSEPPLTSVHAPAEYMGEFAAHAMSMLSRDAAITYQTPVRLTLPCTLAIRKSCARADH